MYNYQYNPLEPCCQGTEKGIVAMTYAGFFQALSHPSRLRLLKLLSQRDAMSVSELTEQMPQEGSTISRHLAMLRLNGLVVVHQQGKKRYYSMDRPLIERRLEAFVTDELQGVQDPEGTRPDESPVKAP